MARRDLRDEAESNARQIGGGLVSLVVIPIILIALLILIPLLLIVALIIDILQTIFFSGAWATSWVIAFMRVWVNNTQWLVTGEGELKLVP